MKTLLILISLLFSSIVNASVTLYTQPGCRGCLIVKNYLIRSKVPFNECDIALSSSCLNTLMSKGRLETPSVDIDGQFVTGPSIEQLTGMLRARGYLKK